VSVETSKRRRESLATNRGGRTKLSCQTWRRIQYENELENGKLKCNQTGSKVCTVFPENLFACQNQKQKQTATAQRLRMRHSRNQSVAKLRRKIYRRNERANGYGQQCTQSQETHTYTCVSVFICVRVKAVRGSNSQRI